MTKRDEFAAKPLDPKDFYYSPRGQAGFGLLSALAIDFMNYGRGITHFICGHDLTALAGAKTGSELLDAAIAARSAIGDYVQGVNPPRGSMMRAWKALDEAIKSTK